MKLFPSKKEERIGLLVFVIWFVIVILVTNVLKLPWLIDTIIQVVATLIYLVVYLWMNERARKRDKQG